MSGALLYALLLLIAIACALAAGRLIAWCMRSLPTDRSEDRAADDARVQQVRDSMRGTL